MIAADAAATLARDGRVWLREALDEDALQMFDRVGHVGRPGARLSNGIRAYFSLTRLIDPLLPGAEPVRAISFDKTGSANWGVPWHQDRVIAVAAREERDGFGNWSLKQGVWHCEPPLNVLAGMLFVRVHLDPATRANGCMEIALGSHRLGAVRIGDAAEIAGTSHCEPCLAERGDVLVMHMLMLHRSKPAECPAPRRAIRVDYANIPLPAPLAWTDAL